MNTVRFGSYISTAGTVTKTVKNIIPNQELVKNLTNVEFEQGPLGECFWLAIVDALSRTKKGVNGLSKLFKKIDGDNYEIVFPGFRHMPIPVNNDEILYGCQAKGNKELNILELAWCKLNEITKSRVDLIPDRVNNNNLYKLKPLQEGGNPSAVLCSMIKARKIQKKFTNSPINEKEIKKIFEEYKQNPDAYCLTASIFRKLDRGKFYFKPVYKIRKISDGILQQHKCPIKKLKAGLLLNHAYTIRNIKDEHIFLANPHNNRKEIKLTIEEFFDNFTDIKGGKLVENSKLKLKKSVDPKKYKKSDLQISREFLDELRYKLYFAPRSTRPDILESLLTKVAKSNNNILKFVYLNDLKERLHRCVLNKNIDSYIDRIAGEFVKI